MFSMRRYRLFLLVAALSATILYYLSSSRSWELTDIDRLAQANFNSDSQKPQAEDPVVQPPPPPADVIHPIEPPAVSSKAVPNAASSSLSSESLDAHPSSTATSTRNPSIPTTSGEELLGQDSDVDVEFAEEGSGRWEIDASPKDGRKPTWRKPETHFPLAEEDIIRLPSGAAQKIPKIQAKFPPESSAAKKDRISKLNAIKESFKHAWNGYKDFGLPHDEVKPVSKSFADPFMGWGATLVDTLDTLWMMGLMQEFEAAVAEVEKIDFHSSLRKDLPLFETTIRYLGGLLAAYDLSQFSVLLAKAEELAEVLMGAFDTPNRMPITFYNWAPSYTSQPHRASAHAVMAELGSLSVEMTRLAQITKNHAYYDAVARITDEFEKLQSKTLIPGLWPLKMDASGCKKAERRLEDYEDEMLASKPVLIDSEEFDINGEEPAVMPAKISPKGSQESSGDIAKRAAEGSKSTPEEKPSMKQVDQEILAVECTPQGLSAEPNAKTQTYGIGGQADSTYEYFPKMYQLLRGRSQQYERMYTASADAIRKELLFRPMIQESKRPILFASKHDISPKAKSPEKRKSVFYEVTHLSCFVGGMFGLGAKVFGIEDDLELAKQLTDGCVWAYESMPTGVMAESATVVPCPSLDMCAWNETTWHQALDPQLDERFAAVDAWNKNQKEIYERSRKEALREAAVAKDDVTGPVPTKEAEKAKVERVKREVGEEDASKTLPTAEFEEKTSSVEPATDPIRFFPKVALSHGKFVKARIQEERLPPSYTHIFARHYGLRPEAIESVFYMYRLTGDDIWRQKGWKMFEAVQSATQTEVANAAMKDVTSNLGELDDSMESFWLAETLKYFYLLFSDPELMSLDQWVANTEAHFFKIPA